MARYDLVQIGSTYLTADGLISGTRCKTDITNKGRLNLRRTGQVVIAADDTVYIQNVATHNRAVEFSIKISWLSKTIYDIIVAAFQTALDNGTILLVTIDGDTYTGVVTATPDPKKGIDSGKFRNGILVDDVLNFISVT